MVTIHITENTANAKAFINYAKTLKFAEVQDVELSPSQISFLKKLKRSANHAREIAAGKRKGNDLIKMLNEL
jgi:uncharacterized DUF497 family protein